MTFDAYENSIESGRPIEIYHFSVGLEHFYYTSAEDTISYGGQQYVSRQLGRNSPEQTSEGGKSKLEVSLPTDDLVCSRFIGIVQPEPMYIMVTRFHRQDLLDGRVVWNGRMIQAVYTKNATTCKMTFVASESVYSRPIPHYKYQALCNHMLYDGSCTLDQDSYKFTATASGESGSQLTVAGLQASQGAGWAIGGKVVFRSDSRMVNNQAGDVLTLSMPFRNSPNGQSVDVHAGCDHTIATCENKFSNALNYGGFPFVPLKNPFATGVK